MEKSSMDDRENGWINKSMNGRILSKSNEGKELVFSSFSNKFKANHCV